MRYVDVHKLGLRKAELTDGYGGGGLRLLTSGVSAWIGETEGDSTSGERGLVEAIGGAPLLVGLGGLL